MNGRKGHFAISWTVASITFAGSILFLYAVGAIKTANNESPPFIAIIIFIIIVIALTGIALKDYYKHHK
ncbi:MAG TPA: hypothetical protein VFW60_10475 [Rhodanobacteraceae bacterium]|nr:hypothetical protein [Rhodanobacteraceae bacterium]